MIKLETEKREQTHIQRDTETESGETIKRDGHSADVAHLVEGLPSTQKTLGPVPSTTSTSLDDILL